MRSVSLGHRGVKFIANLLGRGEISKIWEGCWAVEWEFDGGSRWRIYVHDSGEVRIASRFDGSLDVKYDMRDTATLNKVVSETRRRIRLAQH